MLYTVGEEIFNSVTHGIGAIFSIVALCLMVTFSALNGGTAIDIISFSIYGASLIILYTMSTLYHAITNEKAKKVLRIIDHSSVYLLIAGSYTPFALSILKNQDEKRIIILIFVWLLAIIGTVLYSIFKQKIKIFNIVSYIIMGWAVSLLLPELNSVFTTLNIKCCLYLLIAGGITYTAGIIFYAIKKVKYFHSIWHLFVLSGSILHFIAVMIYIFNF
ncbi:channel protein hemolysin III family [Clostridium sp. CAG:921]|nr:channel protein hemolysin III family [Clostridium sp. CAG:921]